MAVICSFSVCWGEEPTVPKDVQADKSDRFNAFDWALTKVIFFFLLR